MPRYVVATRRDCRGVSPSAYDAVKSESGVSVVSADNPDLVTVEMAPETASDLSARLGATHFVEAEVRRSIL